MDGKKLYIQGIVQGVGFRPFIKRLADSLHILGSVSNSSSGVTVTAFGSDSLLDEFIKRITLDAPPLAHIISIKEESFDGKIPTTFIIDKSSKNIGITTVSPDVSICGDCRQEIDTPSERRHNYPFTNCTNCGPRYSIIKSLPYDRCNTSMDMFKMCPKCLEEYNNSADRRFHAQPIACPICGPKIFLNYKGKIIDNQEETFKLTADEIHKGGIVAIKGLGGYHLVCDAKSNKGIEKLRSLKNRKTKPLAVMCKDISALDKYIKLDEKYRQLLTSPEAPIVIFSWDNNPLSPLINPISNKIGVMLAYTPMHVLLFNYLKTDFIVATSGNLRDESIAKDEDEAEENLSIFTDVFLHHNRPIHTRLDDSVMAVTNNSYTLLRRSRGFAPYPVIIKSDKKEEVFAAGANLKSGLAFYRNGFAFLSQYIGDLDTVDALELYGEVYTGMKNLFSMNPVTAVSDIHPSYRSTEFSSELGLNHIKVQHHKAHFASCMAENAFYGDAVGIILDGFGIGDDGEGWGGEFFLKKGKIMERVGHLRKFMQPGMDSAAKNPARMLVSYLYGCHLLDNTEELLIKRTGLSLPEINIIKVACDKGINSILTTSAGRLFEAIGSLLVCKKSNEYEGELAVTLESIAADNVSEGYEFKIDDYILDPQPAISQIISDIYKGEDVGVISAKFHNGFGLAVVDICAKIAHKQSIKTVALSGGVFQNIRLLNRVTELLETRGFQVLTHKRVPSNDGGIALGQLYYYLTGIN